MNAALGWTGLAASAIGGVSYFVVLLRRPNLVRILNGSGLLFCALALSQGPAVLHDTTGSGAFAAQTAVGLLILGVLAQAVSALRNRRAWDGAERRSNGLESRA